MKQSKTAMKELTKRYRANTFASQILAGYTVNDIVTPDAKLALTYDFRRKGLARVVTLANGSGYVAEGENMKRFGVELTAGVTVKVDGNTDVGLSYEGKFKDLYTDHTILLNAKYNF